MEECVANEIKNHGYIHPVSIHADVVKESSKQAYPHTDGNQLWILFEDFYPGIDKQGR